MVAGKWPTPLPVKRALRVFGEHVVTWRKLLGLTSAQVAERAGVSRGTLLRLEKGSGAISFENTLRIARALGVLDKLLNAVDPFETDIGRMRSLDNLPQRVRRPRKDAR